MGVLKEGKGMDHPKPSTPCECHYAGRLIDGKQFDSSYDRGEPTTFAPNQVIKGWTEAMQLMVLGDKWEMYIPYQLAYGESGRPPTIPAKAMLTFVMEIVKIKGDTVPKQVEFPEWTEDKLKEKYPTREEFDAWLDKQCKTSKDKSLWKRTKHAKAKEAEDK